MWQKHKIWIIIGGLLALTIIGGIVENSANSPAAPTANSTPTTPTTQAAQPATSGQLQVQGDTVSDGEYTYKLLPINGLNSSGSVATEGIIAQVIPDAATKSHTPYYLVLQSGGNYAVISIVVPKGEEQNFDVNIFPIGTKILVAGAIFPFDNQAGVFNYSELVQATDVAPAVRQLNLPSDTPVIQANYQDLEVLH